MNLKISPTPMVHKHYAFTVASDPGNLPQPPGELLLHHALEFFSLGQSPAEVCKGFQKEQEQLNTLISNSYF